MTQYTLHLGDCLEYMRGMDAGSVDAVITDPPYGMNLDTDNTRFSGGNVASIYKRGNSIGTANGRPIIGDDKPFDPSPFLDFKRVILWGFNHFAQRLPVGTTLVWVKRLDPAFGSFLSDAELAWMKGGHGVYCMRDLSLTAETRDRKHPTQKPLPLMRWCIELITQPGDTIFDPFMGSGTTGVACMQLGRNFIGCEIDQTYFSIAERRIRDAAAQPALFTLDTPQVKPTQDRLIS